MICLLLLALIQYATANKYIVDVIDVIPRRFTIDGDSAPALNLPVGRHMFRLNHNNNAHPFLIRQASGDTYNRAKGNDKMMHVIIDEETPALEYYCGNHVGMGNTLKEAACDLCNVCTSGTDEENCWWKEPGKTNTSCPFGNTDCQYSCVDDRCQKKCTKFCTSIDRPEKGQTEIFNFVLKNIVRSRSASNFMQNVLNGTMPTGDDARSARIDIIKTLKDNEQESVELSRSSGKHVFKRRIGKTKEEKRASRPILERSDVLTLVIATDGWETFTYEGTNYVLTVVSGVLKIEKDTQRRMLRRLTQDISQCFEFDPSSYCTIVDGEWQCDIPGDVDVLAGCKIVDSVVSVCPEGSTNLGTNKEECDKCDAGYGGNPCEACVNGQYNSDVSDLGTGCANMTCGFGSGVVHVNKPQTTNRCEFCTVDEYSPTNGTGQCLSIPEGYECSSTGDGCSSIRDIDDCDPNPCQNGAACQDEGANSYTCACVAGYSGDNCEVADACTAGSNGQPCQNGGTATGTTGNCGCSCAAGYSGDNCEVVDACTAGANGQPCQNGGTVTGTTGNCGCSCAAGYSGDNCEVVDACTAGANGQPCQNGGTATGTTGNCGCNCAAGYSGDNCEVADACTAGANGQPCQNGGTVTGTTGNCGCSCAAGYSGDNCETVDVASTITLPAGQGWHMISVPNEAKLDTTYIGALMVHLTYDTTKNEFFNHRIENPILQPNKGYFVQKIEVDGDDGEVDIDIDYVQNSNVVLPSNISLPAGQGWHMISVQREAKLDTTYIGALIVHLTYDTTKNEFFNHRIENPILQPNKGYFVQKIEVDGDDGEVDIEINYE